jgi:hypothetical protein
MDNMSEPNRRTVLAATAALRPCLGSPGRHAANPGTLRPENSLNSFQKRFARGSDHCANRSDPRASRI